MRIYLKESTEDYEGNKIVLAVIPSSYMPFVTWIRLKDGSTISGDYYTSLCEALSGHSKRCKTFEVEPADSPRPLEVEQ